MYMSFLLLIPLFILVVFIGVVLHAKFYQCDPLITGAINGGNEVNTRITQLHYKRPAAHVGPE